MGRVMNDGGWVLNNQYVPGYLQRSADSSFAIFALLSTTTTKTVEILLFFVFSFDGGLFAFLGGKPAGQLCADEMAVIDDALPLQSLLFLLLNNRFLGSANDGRCL